MEDNNKNQQSEINQSSSLKKKAWKAPKFQEASISSETMAGSSTYSDGGGYSA